MREIALDTETTGLDPSSGHRLVEIGCVEMHGRIRTGKTFHVYLNPERDVPEEAEKVHGLSTSFLLDKPLFRDKAQEFLDFIGDAPLVIHNAQFDLKFLNAELKANGLPVIEFSRATDTVLMARQKFPGSPANLDALCKRFMIDLSARTKHGALLDAELLADVYLELTGGRQAGLMLDEEDHQHEISHDYVIEKVVREAREFAVSDAEKEAHAKFIAKLKNPIWNKIAAEG